MLARHVGDGLLPGLGHRLSTDDVPGERHGAVRANDLALAHHGGARERGGGGGHALVAGLLEDTAPGGVQERVTATGNDLMLSDEGFQAGGRRRRRRRRRRSGVV